MQKRFYKETPGPLFSIVYLLLTAVGIIHFSCLCCLHCKNFKVSNEGLKIVAVYFIQLQRRKKQRQKMAKGLTTIVIFFFLSHILRLFLQCLELFTIVSKENEANTEFCCEFLQWTHVANCFSESYLS